LVNNGLVIEVDEDEITFVEVHYGNAISASFPREYLSEVIKKLRSIKPNKTCKMQIVFKGK